MKMMNGLSGTLDKLFILILILYYHIEVLRGWLIRSCFLPHVLNLNFIYLSDP
jgi:hypothetical protein